MIPIALLLSALTLWGWRDIWRRGWWPGDELLVMATLLMLVEWVQIARGRP